MTPYSIRELVPASRRGATITLPGIEDSRGARRSYLAALRKMLAGIFSAARTDVVPMVQDNEIPAFRSQVQELVAIATEAVRRILRLEGRRHTRRFREIAQRRIGIDLSSVVRNEDLADFLEDAMIRSAALVRGLAEDAHTRVARAVSDTMLAGQTQRQLRSRLVEELGILDRRAELIASDQVATVTSELNERRHRQAGITQYTWRTSRDERVRPLHRRLEGQVYTYGKPTGAEGGLPPGRPVRCRCTAQAIVDFGRGR